MKIIEIFEAYDSSKDIEDLAKRVEDVKRRLNAYEKSRRRDFVAAGDATYGEFETEILIAIHEYGGAADLNSLRKVIRNVDIREWIRVIDNLKKKNLVEVMQLFGTKLYKITDKGAQKVAREI